MMMDIEKFERDIRSFYKKRKAKSLDKKVLSLAEHVETEWGIAKSELQFQELKTIAESIIEIETQTLHDEVQDLLAQKEQIERQLEKKALALQNAKYAIFNTIEEDLSADSPSIQRDLHQIKLQSIDLFDMLEEMVESAILTTPGKRDTTSKRHSKRAQKTSPMRHLMKALCEPFGSERSSILSYRVP